MKTNSLMLYLLIGMNIVLLGALMFMGIRQSKSTTSGTMYSEQSLAGLNAYKYMLAQYQLACEGEQLLPGTCLVNEHKDSIKIESLISKPTLVMRYSELNCHSCVDAMLTELKNNPFFNEKNSLLLAWYNEPAYLYQFKRMNRIEMPVYNIKNTGLLADTLNMPYFFIIDKDLRVSKVLIPEEGDTTMVPAYLKITEHHFSKTAS